MTKQWIQDIKDYAVLHYEEDGWDFLVETMENSDLEYFARYAQTYAEFFEDVHKVVKTWDAQRQSVQSEIF